MLIKKRTIKIIVGVIVAIAVIVGAVFAFQTISTNIKIKDTENKLSQINAEELESKLISELKQSKFNINTSNLSTQICDWNDLGNTKQGEMAAMTIEIFYAGNKINNPYEDNVSAYITSNKGFAAIPLFKIEKDNNGNFKNIVYSERIFHSSIVKEAIEKVLKDCYDIDMMIVGNAKYNTRFNKFNTDRETMYANKDILDSVFENVEGFKSNDIEYFEEYTQTNYGLDK